MHDPGSRLRPASRSSFGGRVSGFVDPTADARLTAAEAGPGVAVPMRAIAPHQPIASIGRKRYPGPSGARELQAPAAPGRTDTFVQRRHSGAGTRRADLARHPFLRARRPAPLRPPLSGARLHAQAGALPRRAHAQRPRLPSSRHARWRAPTTADATSTRSTAAGAAVPSTIATGATIRCWSSSTTPSTS